MTTEPNPPDPSSDTPLVTASEETTLGGAWTFTQTFTLASGETITLDEMHNLITKTERLRRVEAALREMISVGNKVGEVMDCYHINGDYNNEDIIEAHGLLSRALDKAEAAIATEGGK